MEYWEQALFSWPVGNAGTHLKNYSLCAPDGGRYRLASADDLTATTRVVPGDSEELALTIGGRKRKLAPQHFRAAKGLAL